MSHLEEKTMFVGIGAQKSGTTWLYNYLQSHPQVFLSPLKEMHIFDFRHVYSNDSHRELLMNRIANLASVIARKNGKDCKDLYDQLLTSANKSAMIDNVDYYIDYFKHRVTNQKVFGEITPAYSLLPPSGFEEILSIHQNVKFIYIMRDPIERAWSHINDEFSRKGMHCSSREKLQSIYFSKGKNNYLLKSNYESTISVLEKTVSREKILYLFYEDLFTENSINNICEFLDIDAINANFQTKVNEGKYESIDIYPKTGGAHIYEPIYKFCRNRFGTQVPETWHQ